VTDTIQAAAAPRRRQGRFAWVAAALGPGLIAANAGNDAGGILTYVSAGAKFA
jgi:Mn2+/Fe2+ NRAMP family transporter